MAAPTSLADFSHQHFAGSAYAAPNVGNFAPLPPDDPDPEGRPGRERVRSGPAGVVLPWFLPYFDPLQSLGETQQQRNAYRMMLADPNVKSAFLGKVLAVGALDCQVVPASKKDKKDGAAADLVRHNLEECLADGVPGAVWSVLSGALIDGYSVCEKVWGREAEGEHEGAYVLAALKPKDTGHDVVLETDEFRNVVSVLGLRYNPAQRFDPREFVIWRHLPLWGVPTGMSDFRAVYSRWWLLDTVLKLRAIGLEKRAMPVLMGVYQTPQQRPSLESALAQVKSQNWLAVPEGVRVEALSIAGSSDTTFADAVRDLKHDIFLGIQGAVLQSLEGTITDGRGNSQVHRSTADLFIWYLRQSVERLFNDRRNGLVRDVCGLNFPALEKLPKVKLSAVDVAEQLSESELDTRLWSMGVELSREDLYERYGRRPPDPDDPDDRLAGQQKQVAGGREDAREPGEQVEGEFGPEGGEGKNPPRQKKGGAKPAEPEPEPKPEKHSGPDGDVSVFTRRAKRFDPDEG
jgi:hypothetical protein